MKKKKSKKTNLFKQPYILALFFISIVIFSSCLLYKQFLPKYLIYSIIIMLVMSLGYLIYLLKKYKKQRNFIKTMTIILSVILIISSAMIISHNDKLAKEGEYIGIDISKWNKDVDLRLASQEIDFVIIRCGYTSLTDGTKTKSDPLFEQNVKQCQDYNIPYGVYYYSLARDASQAKKEAKYVTELLDNRVPELGVFIDLEDEDFQGDLSNEQLTTVATTFLDNIQNQNKKGIYANHHWWTTKLTDDKLDSYIKWKARYNDEQILEDEYDILQFTETGSIRGVDGNVDINKTTKKYW